MIRPPPRSPLFPYPALFRSAIPPRPETGEATWPCHATGYLSDSQPSDPTRGTASWPPADAEPVAIESFYDALAQLGCHYGLVFQGVRAAWRRGTDTFAEIALPEDTDVTGFTLHPALLDAALHPSLI